MGGVALLMRIWWFQKGRMLLWREGEEIYWVGVVLWVEDKDGNEDDWSSMVECIVDKSGR